MTDAPLKLPVVEVAGVAGFVVTEVVPNLTDVIVLLALKPNPLKNNVWPAATEVIVLPLEVAATVAPGLSVKGMLAEMVLSFATSM